MGLRKRPYSEEKGGKRSAPKSSSGAAKSASKSRFSKDDKPSFGAKKSGFGSTPAKRSYTRSSGDDKRPSRFGNESGDRRPSTRPYTKRTEGGSEDRRPSRFGNEGGDRRPSTRPYTKRTEGGSEDRRPSRFGNEGGDRRPSARPYTKRTEGGREERRPSRFGSEGGDRRPSTRPYTKRTEGGSEDRRPSKFGNEGGDRRPSASPYTKRNEGGSEDRRTNRFGSEGGDRRSTTRGGGNERGSRFDRNEDNKRRPTRSTGKSGRPYMVKGAKARDLKAKSEEMMESLSPEIVRLNRYISNAGICSRREADDLISAGLVSVNGEIVTEMGYKVSPGDEIRYNNERLSWEKKVYLLMNKPKDSITTSDDPEGRKIIMDLIKDPRLPRVYPVGRLDRNTTGVILLTNDGELAQRLTHPKYGVVKVYKAVLNKSFSAKDLQELGNNGVDLEDGPIKPDGVGIPSASEKNVVLVQIHSGRNHIIHRMFEAMGYLVDKLDRLEFAGLERKGLDRGEWRHLDDKEIKKLKKLVQMK